MKKYFKKLLVLAIFFSAFLCLTAEAKAIVIDGTYSPCPNPNGCLEAKPADCCATKNGDCIAGSSAWTYYYGAFCAKTEDLHCDWAYVYKTCSSSDRCEGGNQTPEVSETSEV